MIQIADGILKSPHIVENSHIFIQNNSENSLANHRPSAEETDSFFEILNRLSDYLLNPHIQTVPPVLTEPSVLNSFTLEEINRPEAFTPYFHFEKVLDELNRHGSAIGGTKKSVDLIEFPVKNNIYHGQMSDKFQNLVNSQQIRPS